MLAARSGEPMAAIAEEIVAAGGRAVACTTDFTDTAAVELVVALAGGTFGRLEIAFNNAGAGHFLRPQADLSIDEFEFTDGANLLGVSWP